MAAADDKGRDVPETSRSSDVVFAYCPVCKANYDDYSGKCLCSPDAMEIPEEKKEGGSVKDAAGDTHRTGGAEKAPEEQCAHKEGLQNSFDVKVQSMDTPGDTCLSRSETHSVSETCPSLNIVLEEQCATDACEEIGLSTVCAITENVLGRRRKNASAPGLGLRAMDEAQRTRNIASTSSTSLLQEIGADAPLPEEGTTKRTFEVFIVDNDGNMDTYELNKIHTDKGSHIIVNKKEQGRRVRHAATEEPVKSILEELGVISTSAGKGPCAYCGDVVNQNVSLRQYKGNTCPRCSSESSSRRESTGGDASAGKEPVLSYVADKPDAPDNAMIMRPIEDPVFMHNDEREDVQEDSQFGNTIIFEESRGQSSQSRKSTSRTQKSKASVRTNGKVAQLIQFYEGLSKGGDSRVCPKASETCSSPQK